MNFYANADDEGGDPGVETEQRKAGSAVLAYKGQEPERDNGGPSS